MSFSLAVIPDLTRLGEASGVAWVGNPDLCLFVASIIVKVAAKPPNSSPQGISQ